MEGLKGLNLKKLKGAFTDAAASAAQLVGQQLKAGVESVGALKATRDYELGPQVRLPRRLRRLPVRLLR
jgi:hypothetical protein